MVSSFIIKTNICIPNKLIAEFNEYSENFNYKEARKTYKFIKYYDCGDCVKFIKENEIKKEKTGCFVEYYEKDDYNWLFNGSNWEADWRGHLFDNCDKFYYSVSILKYFIDTFFEPHGIQINGYVAGFNIEHPLMFLYYIEDNEITFGKETSFVYMDEMKALLDKADSNEDDNYYDKVKKMVQEF